MGKILVDRTRPIFSRNEGIVGTRSVDCLKICHPSSESLIIFDVKKCETLENSSVSSKSAPREWSSSCAKISS